MSDLSEDRVSTALACRTSEELSQLAEEWGIEEDALLKWRDEVRKSFDALTESEPVQQALPAFRLHHVGMVVANEGQMKRIAGTLGMRQTRSGYLEKYRVTNVFFQGSGGGPELQFMLQKRGMLANFNRGRGGLHHVAFSVPDLESAQERLAVAGLRFIHPEPQVGIEGFRFNFVHPNLHGLNVEIIEDPWESRG